MKSIKCLLGFHKWKKWGGPSHVGDGKFKQTLICEKCNKMKDRIR